MEDITININNLSKRVSSSELLFKNLSFNANTGDIIAIVGPNGSGKSTLLKILAGVLKPTNGQISIIINNQNIDINNFHRYFGFVSPYLNLYEEFNPIEHLRVICKMRNIKFANEIAMNYLRQFNLQEHYLKPIKAFSSGMKQRMKMMLAILNDPAVLFLDEPFSNLDEEGITNFEKIILDFHNKGNLIFIASNDEREISIANKKVNILNYK
ncbi:MAG TPA: ABC transporter ATP-binding protein [Bacteroidota bacterium]|nr:ABC transporter ATP-binding protein [Bacteroidota bacterium]